MKLRRLNEDEKPLVLAILWGKNRDETKKFVLQVFSNSSKYFMFLIAYFRRMILEKFSGNNLVFLS